MPFFPGYHTGTTIKIIIRRNSNTLEKNVNEKNVEKESIENILVCSTTFL